MRKIYPRNELGLDLEEEKLVGDIVEIRPSQIKFKCDMWDLEVIRCATFSQGYLNRQVILLFSCLGVKEEIFLGLLENSLNNLDFNKIYTDLLRRS